VETNDAGMARRMVFPKSMTESTDSLFCRCSLVAASGLAGELSVPTRRSGQLLAECLREMLEDFAGRAFDFSEPVQEGDDWDICARRGHEGFRLQVAFLESAATEAPGELVITILPEFNWNPFKARNHNGPPSSINLLKIVVGKVLKRCQSVRPDLRGLPMIVVTASGKGAQDSVVETALSSPGTLASYSPSASSPGAR
jgi:hypothetical protein